MSNIEVVEDVTSFPKCPITHLDNTWSRIIEGKKLGFHSCFTRQIFRMNMNQSHARLHNICFAGLKIVFYSIINGLHNWLRHYPIDSSFIQINFLFWEESNISILVKQALCTKSISWARNLFALIALHLQSQRHCV